MTYDSPFLVATDLVKEVGLQNTIALEDGGEFARADLIKAAHNAIYQELEARGIDPTKLTNEARLKSAISWEWCLRLASHGYLDPLGDRKASIEYYRQLRNEALRRFVPTVSSGSGDAPRIEGAPAVANFEHGWAYGPTGDQTSGEQRYWDDVPTSRTR